MKISKRSQIDPFIVMDVMDQARNLEISGKRIIHMEVGQPNNDDLSGPTVDGDDESPQRLSMLSNNKSKFDCCTNSPFTTNSGCICITEKQRHFINTRGFNKSQPDI